MPIEFKCESNGYKMCETCFYGDDNDKAVCDMCGKLKCPIIEGYEYISSCKHCMWEAGDEYVSV